LTSGNLWFTQSADYGVGADCVAGSPWTLVTSRYWLRGQTTRFNVIREFLRLVGHQFVMIGRLHLVTESLQLQRFPEFSGGYPFAHCAGRIGLQV